MQRKKKKLNHKAKKKKIIFEEIKESFEQKRSMIVAGCSAFGCAC